MKRAEEKHVCSNKRKQDIRKPKIHLRFTCYSLSSYIIMNECSATDFVYSAISFIAIMSLDLYILSNTYIMHPAKFLLESSYLPFRVFTFHL